MPGPTMIDPTDQNILSESDRANFMQSDEERARESEDLIDLSEEKLRKYVNHIDNRQQTIQEKRYQKAVEQEHNLEIRKTVDIFNTPLLLRRDIGVSSFLEMDRREKIVAPGVTQHQLMKSAKTGMEAWFGADTISMSLTIPFDMANKEEIIANLLKINPNLKQTAIESLIEEAGSLSGVTSERLPTKQKIEEIAGSEESRGFIKKLLEDPEKVAIWLTMQKLFFTADEETLRSVGENTYATVYEDSRQGMMLIDPNIDGATVDPVASSDYAFEIWALKGIPLEKIQGFIAMPDTDETRKTISASLNSEIIYNLYPEEELIQKTADYVRMRLRQIKTGMLTEDGSTNNNQLTDDERQSRIKDVANLLDRRSFGIREADDLIEITPGLFTRHNRYGGEHVVNTVNEQGRLTTFPDLDISNMTLRDIQLAIFKRREESLKQLFPGIKFSPENVRGQIHQGLCRYLKDKYQIDPENTTVKEFTEMMIKRFNIPIYNLQGDQIWPQNKPHEQIAKE